MSSTALRWIRRNLFARPFDAVLSVVVIPSLAWCVWSLLAWGLFEARWSVLSGNLRILMVGTYPAEELWRAWVVSMLIAAMLGIALGSIARPTRTGLSIAVMLGILGGAIVAGMAGVGAGIGIAGCVWLGSAAAAGIALAPSRLRVFGPLALLLCLVGIFAVYAPPGLGTWGGLLLSVILTLVTSCLTLPFGILLALGRQSRITSLRVISTAYIETMRSVPLILVVYWIWILVPLLFPDVPIAGVLRAMAGYALFFAAYVAEYVRSGLQALPPGQVEAARSLGMGTWSVNVDIVLPQALRVAVPALVGQVLDIFNGATLIFILGLTDFLRAGQMILADPQTSGRSYEIYLFLFAVYFVIGAAITWFSRRIEARLSRGAR